MSDMSSGVSSLFTEIHDIVAQEFSIEESFIEYDNPTFYVRLQPDSKQAFLRLIQRLDRIGYVPILRRKGTDVVLRVVRKPPTTPSSWIINAILFFATIGTTLATGYMLSSEWVERGLMSDPMIGAAMFTLAIMTIFGTHEMAHKFAARKHRIEASYPYFIPGPPLPFGIGTFGAVIRQKSLAPNKDALFDLGVSGPIIGFITTILVTIIGVQLSVSIPISEVPPGTPLLPVPLAFRLIATFFPPMGSGEVTWLHPVAFAGWVGMLVTMLNLMPTGTLDGGHAVRGLLGERARSILSIVSIAVLFILGHYLMAILALFLSLQRHPGPLDDVSGLTLSRKIVALSLVAIFILTAAPVWHF